MRKMLNSALLALTMFGGAQLFAQQPAMQYFRTYDQTGINVFETSKNEGAKYDGLKVRIGGGFTQQFQA